MKMHRYAIVVVVSLLLIVGSCGKWERLELTPEEERYNIGAIEYPYEASAERWKQIETGYKQLKEGMSVQEVVDIMGEPDDITPYYEGNIWSKQDVPMKGKSYWYILRRLEEVGSTYKSEALVRVFLSEDERMTGMQNWGF